MIEEALNRKNRGHATVINDHKKNTTSIQNRRLGIHCTIKAEDLTVVECGLILDYCNYRDSISMYYKEHTKRFIELKGLPPEIKFMYL